MRKIARQDRHRVGSFKRMRGRKIRAQSLKTLWKRQNPDPREFPEEERMDRVTDSDIESGRL